MGIPLFQREPEALARAKPVSSRTFEFSELSPFEDGRPSGKKELSAPAQGITVTRLGSAPSNKSRSFRPGGAGGAPRM